MATKRRAVLTCLVVISALFSPGQLQARRKYRRHHHYRRRHLPPVTHPVVLWARTLTESQDREARKIAAFKLSQYTQPIFQDEVIRTLIGCMHDPDVHIKVLCAKAMSHTINQSESDRVRDALIDEYKTDPILKDTITRTFIARKDFSPEVHDLLLDSAKQTKDPDQLLVLLEYLEQGGSPSDSGALITLYNANSDVRVKRAAVKALGTCGRGQDAVIDILAACAQSKDTPLALTCLDGLQLQARTSSKTWSAIESTIESDDPDVLLSTMDLIHALPETKNEKVSARLVDIINDTDDSDMIGKAVLALDVCGVYSDSLVKALQKLLDDPDTEEGTRISAALVLGKQAPVDSQPIAQSLAHCSSDDTFPSLKMACGLGIQELDARRKVASAPSPSPSPSLAPVAKAEPPATKPEKKKQ